MITSLARANIVFEWKLFSTAIIILTLSGCLIYVAMGITISNIRSFSSYERSLDVDLYVRQSDLGWRKNPEGISSDYIYNIREYTDVQDIDVLNSHYIMVNSIVASQSKRVGFRIVNVDEPSLLTPKLITATERRILKRIGNVFLTESTQNKLGVHTGDSLWLENTDIELVVAGTIYGDLGGAGLLGFSSNNLIGLETALLIEPTNLPPEISSHVSSILIKLKEGIDIQEAQVKISQLLNNDLIEVILPQQKSRAVSWDVIMANKAVQGFLVMSVFATLIPLAIVVQTLRNAILAQKTQFSTLRAIGIPLWRVVQIVIEQSVWVGILAAALSCCVAMLIQLKLSEHGIHMSLNSTLVSTVSGTIVLAAVFAGTISLLTISKIQPLDLLR